ncbi:hypothetical protein KAJ02_11850, partial [Candidatus Bipolaricaulota bacterium]|nr:hypothetical protein [Candidatus Bipolaricaulota bacterium]
MPELQVEQLLPPPPLYEDIISLISSEPALKKDEKRRRGPIVPQSGHERFSPFSPTHCRSSNLLP